MQHLIINPLSIVILLFVSFDALSNGLFIERNKASIEQCYENSALSILSELPLDERVKPCLNILNHRLNSVDNKAIASYNAAVIYFNAGDTLKAQGYVTQSIELRPQVVASHNLLAHLYYQQGELKLASECYEKSLNLDPSNQKVAKNLSIIQSKLYPLTARH